ncbi:YecA family protein [Ramlibacter rhizophilus]|uniref:YecA family protein n=1 Tax=Ramlibacter rhizophilus TaxID=1781167 RepID=A0A4Z0BFM7_9BURK|nr:UPF0149 family protein [Ramlibacter rhizophilus]TFY98112.1 YecA family protein [Ramlibacter rhizophilus]
MTSPDMASPDTAPLGTDDFDAQDAVLDALREQDELTPDWEFCEGFLTALVCCRREIPPEEYWPVLLGESFRPMEHMEFVWRWKRRWQEVRTALDADVERLDDERALQPEVLDVRGALLALPEDQRGDADFAQLPGFAQGWAEGFLYAVESWPEEWAPPRDRESAAMLEEGLAALGQLAQPDTQPPAVSMHEEDGPPSVSERRLDDFADAIWAAYELRRVGRSLGPRVEPLRRGDQPGRNDPCPCGSGKKFKKCHGAG